MKNILNIVTALTLTISTVFATTTPEMLITSEEVVVLDLNNSDIFISSEFDDINENLSFTTKSNMNVVQIFNEAGVLEFQLPVMSNNVKINKNLFDTGAYKLGFVLEGKTDVYFTEVTIN